MGSTVVVDLEFASVIFSVFVRRVGYLEVCIWTLMDASPQQQGRRSTWERVRATTVVLQ